MSPRIFCCVYFNNLMIRSQIKLIMLNHFTVCKADDAPLVNTPLGDIAGSWRKSFDGRRFAAFEGIPYAKPPIGELRFEVRYYSI